MSGVWEYASAKSRRHALQEAFDLAAQRRRRGFHFL
jgi:hypothetical protein